MANRKNPSPDAGEPAATEPAPGDGAVANAPAAPDEVDVRDQFRQALERKRRQETDGHGGAGSNGPKLRSASGPVGAKRQFRRKSGG